MRQFIVVFAVLPFMFSLSGCGGGSKPPAAPAPVQRGQARFSVDVATGKVTITKLAATRAVYSGSAVSFTSSDLLSVGGDAGKRVVRVTAANNSGEAWDPSSVNLVVSDIETADAARVRENVRVSTLAGNGSSTEVDGMGTAASLRQPWGVTIGAGPSAGALFVSDYAGQTIRRIEADGMVRTVAGGANTMAFADGTGTMARFASPAGLAIDSQGNLFVADYDNNRVRRITPQGQVTTIAGNGFAGSTNGAGDIATLSLPMGLACSADGRRIYVSCTGGTDLVRLVSFTGARRDLASSYTVSTVAGGGRALVDGVGAAARFNRPQALGLVTDAGGQETLFVADTLNYAVRRIDQPASGAAVVTTVVGDGVSGSLDGPGSVARLDYPTGVTALPSADGSLDVFVSDYTRVRVLHYAAGGDPGQKGSYRLDTLAGQLTIGYQEGNGLTALFGGPRNLAVSSQVGPSTMLYVADYAAQRVRTVSVPSGAFHSGAAGGSSPDAVAVVNYDTEAPVRAAVVKQMTPTDSTYGTELQFQVPSGVSGFSFLATVEAESGVTDYPAVGGAYITTLAGAGREGYVDGEGKLAEFMNPSGIVAVPSAMRPLYRSTTGRPIRAFISDRGAHAIRFIDTAGFVGTFVGGTAGFADGVGTAARFQEPDGLALDGYGALWVADENNHRIRRVLPNGTVTTVAGSGAVGAVDGAGNLARFSQPLALAVQSGGLVYVVSADQTVRRVRYVDGDRGSAASYQVLTVAGVAGQSGSTDGVGSTARFNAPRGIAADRDGTLYVADWMNGSVRALRTDGPSAMSVATLATGLSGPMGIAVNNAHDVYVGVTGALMRYSPSHTGIALTAGQGFIDGPSGRVSAVSALSQEESGSLLFCDASNRAVRAAQRLVDSTPML